METCPLTSQACKDEKACPLLVTLDDYKGCPFDLADIAIQHFKQNTVLPVAKKLDELVNRFLKLDK